MNSNDTNYIEQLTWLRGIAAFFVIVSHTVRATEVSYYPGDVPSLNPIASALDLGTFGVMLFFALSGCTLYISNNQGVSLKNIKFFYIKRFMRIWPAFVVSLVLYVCFRPVFSEFYGLHQGLWIEKQFVAPISWESLLAYLTLVFNFTGPPGLINNAYWSLPIEFQYYLIFPIIVFSARLGFVGPLLVWLLLYCAPKIFPIPNSQLFSMSLSFCGGVTVGFLYLKFPQYKVSHWIGVFLMGLCISSASVFGNHWLELPDLPFVSNIWNFYSIIAVLSVGVALYASFVLPESLKVFLKRYGDVSYSTYLYHNLVIAAVLLVMLKYSIEGQLRYIILFVLTVVLTHFLAVGSYKWVEKPSINSGRKIIQAWKRKYQE